MALLITYVLIALGFSFLCSIMEAVLLSVTPAYIGAQKKAGSTTADLLASLKTDVDRPLAAILTLNTIAHTVGAAGAGAQAANVFGDHIVGIASAVLTLLILILSEIIPKTLGAVYWRRLAPVVARLLKPLIWILYPFVLLSMGITKLIGGTHNHSVSRAELSAMAELGAKQGVFEQREGTILQHLFEFNELAVEAVMTPRTVMFALPEARPIGELVATKPPLPFSRIPIYGNNVDDVTGFVLRSDVLRAQAQKQEGTLSDLKRDVLVIPADTLLPDLFERFLERRDHIAVVVGTYGSTVGVVTMEDVIETMLGLEIVDESDATTDMQQLARQEWLKRARRLGYWEDGDLDTLDDLPTAAEEQQKAAQFGITGGEPPRQG